MAVSAASAWELLDQRHAVTPRQEWPFAERLSRILIGGGLARAGLADSARHVLVSARGNPQIDPDRELLAAEAAMRAVMGDADEAIRLLKEYLAANPEHRDGLARSQSWWWRDLRSDPRFKALVGLGS
jgi:hypothetical protein